MTNYALASGYLGVQYWNEDKSDLIEIRRAGEEVTEVPDIPEGEAKRLLKLGAIVEAKEAKAAEASPAGAADEPAGNAPRDEWAKYADSLGLTVDPAAKREDIKAQIAESRS